jgi:hypothetical protein
MRREKRLQSRISEKGSISSSERMGIKTRFFYSWELDPDPYTLHYAESRKH